MKTTQIGPFLGINNRLPDFALHVAKTGDYLRDAINVDVTNKGSLRRRESESVVQLMNDGHSLHGNYLMRGSVMYSISLPSYAQALAKTLTVSSPVSWLDVNDDIYYSNGTDAGRITAGAFYPLGMATPNAPAVSVLSGTMFKGRFKVSVSYSNHVTGEEGGLSPATIHTLASDGGIRVTLPGASTGATRVNVYVSTVNGGVMFCAGQYAIGTAYVDFNAQPAQGREGAERFEAPLPAGRLFISNNRLCSIVGSMVYIGLPYRHGYYLPAEGYLLFPADVSIAIENQGGTYVAADKTYWIPGDLGNVEGPLRDVLPYGAVPGTEFVHPTEDTVGWFGEDGFVLAGTDGSVKAVMADNIDQTPPATGCSTVRSTGGYLRVLSCGWCLNLETLAITRYTGFDFTSIADDYGTKATGLYSLTGGGDLPWMISFGKLDFGAEQRKRMPAIYLGCSSPEPLSLRIQTDESDDYTYEARSCSDTVKMHRVDPGLGLESSWFDIELNAGCDFTLASVSFAPAVSGRRI